MGERQDEMGLTVACEDANRVLAEERQWAQEGMERLTAENLALREVLNTAIYLLPDLPTGYEPHGQSMETTMRMHRIRKFRQAVAKAQAAIRAGGEAVTSD